jgi:NAD(P)H-binding
MWLRQCRRRTGIRSRGGRREKKPDSDNHNHRDGCQRGGNIKIAVIGATGATGRRAVKHALTQGHSVTAVARRPERLSSAGRLSFVRGDVLSAGGLTGALDGVEAVISCIGPEKNLSPGTLMSVDVASILTECKRASVRRFILQSGIGLSEVPGTGMSLLIPGEHLSLRCPITHHAVLGCTQSTDNRES